MNKNLFVILLILPFFYACEEEPLDPNDDDQFSYIEIDDPVVGQENIYLAYERPNDPNNGLANLLTQETLPGSALAINPEMYLKYKPNTARMRNWTSIYLLWSMIL